MICQECGAVVEDEARYCPHCGQLLEETDLEDEGTETFGKDLSTPWRHDPGEKAEGHSMLYKIMAIMTGVLLFAAVIVVIFAWWKTAGTL